MPFSILTNSCRAAIRSQVILATLVRYGVWGMLKELGFEIGKRGIRIVGVMTPPMQFDHVIAGQLTRTLIALGPTFIKLGQMLATRPDIVGDAVSNDFRKLFDAVPPISFARIRRILEKELGRKIIKKHILSIDPTVLGSASLAQTHRARLTTDELIILKVQKPGVERTVVSDLLLLEGLARSIEVIQPQWQTQALFLDFKFATIRELDYREEAKNIDRFKKNYKSIFSKSAVSFPSYLPHLTTKRIIALEPMRGVQMNTLKAGSISAKKAAAKSLETILQQIFDHGFFHADPHAGNLFFIEESGSIGLIDLGLVGSLDPGDKKKFLKVLFAILKRDRKGLAEGLFELGTPSSKTDPKRFETSVDKLLDEIKKKGLDQTKVETMVNQLLAIARKEGIFIPNRYVLMLRSCLIIEGVAKQLDPTLSMAAIATPIVAKSLLKTFNLRSLIRWPP